jgi:hypothetical protein
VSLIHAVFIMGGRTIHPSWDRRVENGKFIKFLVGGFYGESIVVVSEFKYLYLEVRIRCEGWFICRWAP